MGDVFDMATPDAKVLYNIAMLNEMHIGEPGLDLMRKLVEAKPKYDRGIHALRMLMKRKSIMLDSTRESEMMRNQLINRLSVNDIYSLCLQTQGKENNCLKEELYQLTFDENDRVSFNALWALTHFDEANNPWLFQKHDELINRVLVEKNETKRRLMLHLLLRQPFEEESLRSDFIDFCIAQITACSQPYAIRCYCNRFRIHKNTFF